MAIKLATGFNIGSKDLIDDRLVLTKEQMLNINEAVYPDHFFSLCSDDNKIYVFDVNNDALDPEVGKFKLYASGEGGVTIDDVTPSTSTVYSSQKIEDTIGKPEYTEKTYTKVYDNLLNKESTEEHEGWYDTDTKSYNTYGGTEKSFVITDGVIAGGNYTATYTGSNHANIFLLDNNLDKIETRDFSLNVTTGTIPENCTTIIISYYSNLYENVSFITGDTNLDGLLKVVKDDTITDENTEIKASDVTVIANIGDFVRIENETQVPSTGVYKYVDDKLVGGQKADWVTNVAVGGLEANTDLNNLSLSDVLKIITRKYVYPSARVSYTDNFNTLPSNNIFEIGYILQLRTTIKDFAAGDYIPTKVIIYDASAPDVIVQENDISSLSDIIEMTAYWISDNSTVVVALIDENGKKAIIDKQTFKWVNGSIYTGIADAIPTISDEIVALDKNIVGKSNITKSFTANNQYIVFAYLKEYGDLKSIIDPNGFENLSDFTKTEVEVMCNDGNNRTYNVYTTNSKKTVSDFKFTFKF